MNRKSVLVGLLVVLIACVALTSIILWHNSCRKAQETKDFVESVRKFEQMQREKAMRQVTPGVPAQPMRR